MARDMCSEILGQLGFASRSARRPMRGGLAKVYRGRLIGCLCRIVGADVLLGGFPRVALWAWCESFWTTSDMAEDLAVLIGSFGQLEHLLPCLKSIFQTASGKSFLRVIVGFNFEGESDSPRALAREFPQVEQLRAPGKLGYCRAYNQLMARCTSRYALLLDDDSLLRAGTIDGMVRFMDAHPEVGIAGCRTVNPDGSYQKTTALMYSMQTEMANVLRPAAFWQDGIDESVTSWKSVGWLNGNFLIVRAQVIEHVGLLDEYFYTFQCEADWCLRIHRAGWNVVYVPDFEVMHIGGRTSNVRSYWALIRTHVNRYYFIRKHYSNVAFHLFRLIMSAGAMLRLLYYLAVWLVSPDRRPEAGLKVKAYLTIVRLGAAVRPDALPDELRRENAVGSGHDFAAEPAGASI
jgi:GT2 family glycosyltransferase